MADSEHKDTQPLLGAELERKKSIIPTAIMLTSAQKPEVKPSNISAAYHRETDTDIFALGEAASNLDNLDDILAGLGSKDEGKEVQGKVERGHRRRPFSVRPVDDLAGIQAGSSVQVLAVSKTLPGGQTIHTRIIQGPVRGTKRVARVMKDTPSGQVFLAELEITLDYDSSKILDLIPPSVLLGGAPVRRRTSSGRYDNWVAALQANQAKGAEAQTSTTSQAEEALIPFLPDYTPDSEDVSQSGESDEDADLAGSRRVSFRKPSMTSGGENEDFGKQDGIKKARQRYESVTEDEIKKYQPQQLEQEEQADEKDDEHSLCWSCARIITRGKVVPKGLIKLNKGKSCMTSSELSEDDPSLPSAQTVVANYARMLVDNRQQFVEMMFRAVKLNKLDVIKILCKIIQKSGLKLGQRDFREPESSATILHVALLYNHTDIVDFLLEIGDRELVMAKYETKEYHNQTGLHVAVASGDPVLVEKLIQALDAKDQVELVNTLADGHYFRDQHPHGQLCLTAAVWAGSGQVIKIIVRHGGDLAMKNLAGNTLLHSIILQATQHPGRHDYRQLFDSVLEATAIWAEQMDYDAKFAQQRELEKNQMCINLFKKLLNCRNNDGFTPLALAMVKTSKLVHHIINLEKIYKIPQNKLGSIAWVTYDVTDVTSFAHNAYNKFSLLHILAHNSRHLSRHANIDPDEDFMEMEPIRTMLMRKWDVYRWIYILWFVVHFSYMMIFTALTVESNSATYNSTRGVVETPEPRWSGFAMFIVLPIFYLALEMLDLFGSTPYRVEYTSGPNYFVRLIKGARAEWTITGNGPYRMVCVGFSFFTLYWFVLYWYEDAYQDAGLAMALLLGWIFILFFTRGCRVTCRFSLMIQKMFFRDLIYFLTVYAIVLVGFSFAMNVMIEESNVARVFYDMMSVVTDLDHKQNVNRARHPMFARLLLIFYAIIAVILLMNMLIAMMNTSYETIRVTRCNLWRQQQLSILLMLERRFFWFRWLCNKSERDVWRRAPSTGDETQRCYVDVTMLHTPSYRCV